MTKLRVGIIGSTGVIGMQLTRLLFEHPRVGKIIPMSTRLAGHFFSSLHYTFRDMSSLRIENETVERTRGCDILFVCKMTDAVRQMLAELHDLRVIDSQNTNCLVIDITPENRASIKSNQHEKGNSMSALFYTCIPEINIKGLTHNTWISAPGCVPTAVSLGLWPLLKSGMIVSSRIIVDVKVASSGAGNSNPGYAQLHQNRSGGVRVYKVQQQHRHAEELVDFLFSVSGEKLELSLNVFSVDMTRGISAAIYFQTSPSNSESQIRKLYRDTYRNKSTVRILSGKDSPERYPNPKWLRGTGLCDIAISIDKTLGQGLIIVAIDNLMKGGASQALQLMNEVIGCGNYSGIPLTPIYP